MSKEEIKYSLVLASGSPRRKELIGHLGIPFKVISADIDENITVTDPQEYCTYLAKEKGRAVLEKLSVNNDYGKSYFPVVVSADTIVCLGHKIYNKPADVNEARQMLLELSGKTHQVYTGVGISRLDIQTGKVVSTVFFDKTEVTFDTISKEILEQYLSTGDSLDKAGSYGIQGGSLAFISNLVGSYSNVVGFPLSLFVKEITSFLNASDSLKNKF
jgi:septum formation protein